MRPSIFSTAFRRADPGVAPLSEDLLRHQKRIGVLSQMIATGVEPAHSIFGLVRVEAGPLSPEARVEALFQLLTEYETAHARLLGQRDLWGECLAHVGSRLSAAVAPRAERLRQLERKRAHLEEAARAGSDDELVERTTALRDRLVASLRSLASSVVAMLRRAEGVRTTLAYSRGLDTEREGLLGRLRERAGARAQMLELEREVHAFEEGHDRETPGDGPVDIFEDLFPPLQAGLNSARESDERLQSLVRDLIGLAEDLEDEGGRRPIGAAESRSAEALLRGPLDDKALVALALIDAPEASGPQSTQNEPLEHRLRKIEVALEHGCLASFGEEAILRRARRVRGAHEWRDYLRRFPEAKAADEARRSLDALDAAAFSAAEGQASRLGYWSYLRDFPEGKGSAKAREALEKMPPVASAPEILKRLAACPDGSLFLGDVPTLSCEVGHGRLQISEGGEVKVLGEKCERFLFVHAAARIRWAVPQGAVRLTAIGTRLDAVQSAHGTWRYEVRLDDRSVFQSGALHEQPEGIPIEITLPSDSRVLEIVVDDYGNGHYDWSVLAYPVFHLAPARAETPAGTPDSKPRSTDPAPPGLN